METLTLQQQIEDGKNVKHSPNRVRFESGSSERGKRRSRRSDSGEPTFMSPLSFEEVDVKNTPLSSMRSCSEYQRQQLEVQANTALNARTSTKSWWSSLFGLSPEPESPVKRASCSFSYINNDKTNSKMKLRRDSIEETMFLVEKLRFNPANLYEGEDYRFPEDIDDEGSTFGQGTCFSINIGGGGGSESSNLYYHSRKHKNTGSIFGESSAAFDYIFGVKLGSDPIPMEIELKCFSSSKIYYNSPDQGEEGIDIEHERLSMECPLRLSLDPNRLSNVSSAEMLAPSAPSTPGSIRRNASWRNLENGTAYNDATDNMTGGTSIEIRFEIDRVTQSLMMRAMMQGYWDAAIAFLKQRFPNSRGQEEFYESIRLQPFASGAYLRCMLLAGLSSTVFEVYNLAVWPVQEEQVALSPNLHALEMFLYINLLVQIFLNIVQLPFRLRIHFLCWESSRAVEVDAAITIIRTMLQSESWLVNKALGKILDGLMLFNLLITEAYLWCSSKTDPLRGLMISLAATNMLTIVARVLVATIFSFSMHDPHVLSEARRRGLSKWDLDVLPTFVYSKPEEVNNGDCPICLCGFEMGEMLISLPCDAKHSFHAACIRQWLQRQNSCPLCQRLV